MLTADKNIEILGRYLEIYVNISSMNDKTSVDERTYFRNVEILNED